MSDKSIELQIALPRSYDASRLQDQAARRPVIDQEQLSQNQLQVDDRNRKRSSETTEADAAKLTDRNGRDTQQEHKENKKDKEKNNPQQSSHPYKGKRIDISL